VRVESSVDVPVAANVVAPFVESLDRYPQWMALAHSVVADSDDAWVVELRAKVGPFARSKRIRMRRVRNDHARGYTFVRDETDGRQHSPWTLTVDLTSIDVGTRVSVVMDYEGSLWVGGVLDKVLASQIEAGRTGLLAAVTQRA